MRLKKVGNEVQYQPKTGGRMFSIVNQVVRESSLTGMPLARALATESSLIHWCLTCKGSVDDRDVVRLVKERQFSEIGSYVTCQNLIASKAFVEPTGCALRDSVERVVGAALPGFEDVLEYDPSSAQVFFEAVAPPPEGEYGDERGDHGLMVAKLVDEYLRGGMISPPKTLVDVGCLGTKTYERVRGVVYELAKGILCDINPIVPIVKPLRKDVVYMIGDIRKLLSDPDIIKKFQGHFEEGGTALFVLNNFLNVLSPEEAWKTFQTLWKTVRTADTVLIINLSEKHIDAYSKIYKLDETGEKEGLIPAAYRRGDPFKTVARYETLRDVLSRLPNAALVDSKEIEYSVLSQTGQPINVYSVQAFLVKNGGDSK